MTTGSTTFAMRLNACMVVSWCFADPCCNGLAARAATSCEVQFVRPSPGAPSPCAATMEQEPWSANAPRHITQRLVDATCPSGQLATDSQVCLHSDSLLYERRHAAVLVQHHHACCRLSRARHAVRHVE